MNITIVGLGYVGLPLAHAFAKKGNTVSGYDISKRRIEELKQAKDSTLELSEAQLKEATINFSNDPAVIGTADVVIMALPTPIDEKNNPDMTILFKASETVGKNLKKGAIVVYESTVYPGVTEELCGPILEKNSGLVCGKDFTLGYSPERINPGDKEHTVTKILKIVSGQDQRTLDALATLYGSVVEAGVHRAPSIRVAEMAKAIENAQRDINIAFVNEIALLCNRLGIGTKDVLEAAGTKWNFLKFSPGLVGGHCIGVDPYYLVEKARQLGMQTHVIAAGRAINDGMSAYIAGQVSHAMTKKGRALVLGLTFKEDIPDTRNSKAQEVARELTNLGHNVEVHDPFLSADTIREMGMTPGSLEGGSYDAILLLVTHKPYLTQGLSGLRKALKPNGVLFDIKSNFAKEKLDGIRYLAL